MGHRKIELRKKHFYKIKEKKIPILEKESYYQLKKRCVRLDEFDKNIKKEKTLFGEKGEKLNRKYTFFHVKYVYLNLNYYLMV